MENPNAPERPFKLLGETVTEMGVARSSFCSETHWISKSPSLLSPLPPPPPPPATSCLKEGSWLYPMSHQAWSGKAKRQGDRRTSVRCFCLLSLLRGPWAEADGKAPWACDNVPGLEFAWQLSMVGQTFQHLIRAFLVSQPPPQS